MAARGNPPSRLSYAGRDPDLSRGTPVSLRHLRALRSPFDHARDPYISAQIKAASKTEAQRREESGRGSLMVKLHRPFPELRPRREDGPLRAAFNRAWFKEQRAARLAQFRAEAQHEDKTMTRTSPVRARSR